MEASYLESPKQSSIWTSPCFRSSAAAMVTSVAISCIILGAVGYSGAGLNAIGTNGGLAMMITGGSILAGEIVALYLKQRGSVLSYQDAQAYKYKLKKGEFFSYQGNEKNGYKKMVMLNHPESDIGLNEYHSCNYSSFKKQYKEVSLIELQES